MAYPRAFISFDYDNNKDIKVLFAGQIKNSRTPFNIEDWSSKDVLPQRQWETLIHTKINRCNIMIVLVGRYTASATGVIKEINFAAENNVPVFGIYVQGAHSLTSLPPGLPRNRMAEWEWPKIADWIDQCMKEGKNK